MRCVGDTAVGLRLALVSLTVAKALTWFWMRSVLLQAAPSLLIPNPSSPPLPGSQTPARAPSLPSIGCGGKRPLRSLGSPGLTVPFLLLASFPTASRPKPPPQLCARLQVGQNVVLSAWSNAVAAALNVGETISAK